MRRKNITGQQVAYWRNRIGWTQKTLAARLQCRGFNISREVVALVEAGLRGVEDNWLPAFQEVFDISIIEFFPKEIRDKAAKLAQHPPAPLPDPGPPTKKKRRRKCPKLTKRRKKV